MIDVLLVDDETSVTRCFPGWLRKAGFACRTAESQRQALDAAAAEWPDVILLDLHLANETLDGWQVWDELEQMAAGRPLRVIVTSAAVDSADLEEVRRRGGRAVRKTAGKEKMAMAIRAALARFPSAGDRPTDNPAAWARILIVEDEAALAASYQRGLEAAGYKTQSVAQGEEALVAFRVFAPDLVLLDLKLAGTLTGFDVLQAIRAENHAVRVIILTNQRGQEQQVFGLTAGADDYVVKNVTPPLLLARVQAQLRRAPVGGAPVFRRGDVRIDLARNLVWRDDRRYVLGEAERRVLARLLQTPDETVPLNELSLAGWSLPLPRPATELDLAPLDGCIYRLRDKLGSAFIQNTRGGYMLALPEERAEAGKQTHDGP